MKLNVYTFEISLFGDVAILSEHTYSWWICYLPNEYLHIDVFKKNHLISIAYIFIAE